jgi:hypothetical protein
MQDETLERHRSSSYSLSDQFCASIACLYSFLSPEQQKTLPKSNDLDSFSAVFSSAKVIESLVHQSIGFSVAPQSLQFADAMRRNSSAIISSADVDDWRFLIDGPAHSGKSTVLSLIASEAVQKLAASGQLARFFIFPVNWELAVQKLTDFTSLYEFLVTQVIYQLTWQCPRLFPVASSLLNWFLSIPSKSSLPSLPFNITGMPLFPIVAVEVVAKQIAACVKRASPSELATMVATLPWTLAADRKSVV